MPPNAPTPTSRACDPIEPMTRRDPTIPHPRRLPKKPLMPIGLGLAVLLLPAAAVGLLCRDDNEALNRALDIRLRSACERDPAPEEVRLIVGTVIGRHEFGRGCRWGDTSSGLVARPTPMKLEEWTRSMGPTNGTAFSSGGIRVELAHNPANCTAAFGSAAGTVEVVSLNEDTTPTDGRPACAKTLAAAAAIADAARGPDKPSSR